MSQYFSSRKRSDQTIDILGLNGLKKEIIEFRVVILLILSKAFHYHPCPWIKSLNFLKKLRDAGIKFLSSIIKFLLDFLLYASHQKNFFDGHSRIQVTKFGGAY